MTIDREFTILNKHKSSLNNSAINRSYEHANFFINCTKYTIPALLLVLSWIKTSNNIHNKDIFDESAASVSVWNINTEHWIEPIKMKISSYFLGLWDKDINDNSILKLDDNYQQNFISWISMDEELDFAPWTHMSETNKENLYLTMYRKLTTEDYRELFKWLKEFKQWGLGNCYFIVAIKNLARSKYFDTLMMTSIEKMWDDSFTISLPLWEPWWTKVGVSKQDLESSTIEWPTWYKILEIWFAKYLLYKKWILPNIDMVITGEYMRKMEKWSAWEVMMSLLWPTNFRNKCLKINPSNRAQILDSLRNFDPKGLWVISVTSKFKQWKTDKNYYKVWWQPIYYWHAYSICGIEKDWEKIKSVIIDNPRNNDSILWWRRTQLWIDDFLRNFYIINIWDTTKDFLNLSTTANELKIVDSRDRRKF